MSAARDEILKRIRAALSDVPEDEAPEQVPVAPSYRRATGEPREEIIARFAQRVAEYRATVHRVPRSGIETAIAEACLRRNVRDLVVPSDIPPEWLPGSVTPLWDEPALSREQLDTSDGVLTGCALGIAQTGTIVLDGGATQGRRALTLLPDYHLCVVYEEQVVGLVPEAIARLGDTVRQIGRPITFISGPSATSDIELNRVEGVHGPRTLEVLLVNGSGESRYFDTRLTRI